MCEYILRRKDLAHAGDSSNIPGVPSLPMHVQTLRSYSTVLGSLVLTSHSR
jgi:hypothetical protein